MDLLNMMDSVLDQPSSQSMEQEQNLEQPEQPQPEQPQPEQPQPEQPQPEQPQPEQPTRLDTPPSTSTGLACEGCPNALWHTVQAGKSQKLRVYCKLMFCLVDEKIVACDGKSFGTA